MALFTFERLLNILETICTIILTAVEKLKKDDTD